MLLQTSKHAQVNIYIYIYYTHTHISIYLTSAPSSSPPPPSSSALVVLPQLPQPSWRMRLRLYCTPDKHGAQSVFYGAVSRWCSLASGEGHREPGPIANCKLACGLGITHHTSHITHHTSHITHIQTRITDHQTHTRWPVRPFFLITGHDGKRRGGAPISHTEYSSQQLVASPSIGRKSMSINSDGLVCTPHLYNTHSSSDPTKSKCEPWW